VIKNYGFCPIDRITGCYENKFIRIPNGVGSTKLSIVSALVGVSAS
jgi:hypothetical protein